MKANLVVPHGEVVFAVDAHDRRKAMTDDHLFHIAYPATMPRPLTLLVFVTLVAVSCASASDDLAVEPAAAPPTTAPTELPVTATVAPTAVPSTAVPSTVVPSTVVPSTVVSSTAVPKPAPDMVAGSLFTTNALADGWSQIQHVAGPGEVACMCSDGSDYSFFVNAPPAADPEKVVLMFEGGGACWDAVTCSPGLGAYKTAVIENRTTYEASDLPGGGIWDRSQNANPFADWTLVFAPYCTGDVHLGTRTADYGEITVEHKGAVNAGAVMDWVVQEHAETDHLFVAGSSAGSIPAPLYAGEMAERLPNAVVGHLSDASGAYPSVPELNAELGGTWGAIAGLPDWPEFAGMAPEEFSLPGLFVAARQHNPDLSLARYDNAFDSVQSLFLLLNGLPGGAALPEGIAAVEAQIEAEAGEIPSYMAPGDEHTILGSSRFYTEAVAGPDGADVVFADWVASLVAGERPPDVTCEDCQR